MALILAQDARFQTSKNKERLRIEGNLATLKAIEAAVGKSVEEGKTEAWAVVVTWGRTYALQLLKDAGYIFIECYC